MRTGGLRNNLVTDSLGWMFVDSRIVGFDKLERLFGVGVVVGASMVSSSSSRHSVGLLVHAHFVRLGNKGRFL